MKKILSNTIITLSLPTILYLILFLLAPARMGSFNSIYIILVQSIVPTIIGYALSFGYVAGIFDFTIGSRIILSGLVGGVLSNQFGFPGLIVGCMVTSIILGMITGGIYRTLKIPSLVVSFGLVMIYEIMGAKLVNGGFLTLKSDLTFLGTSPYNILVLIGTVIIFYLVFYHTSFGNQTRIVGSNELIGQNVGINPMKVKYNTYVIGSIFLGIAAIMQFSYSGSMATQVNVNSLSAIFRPLIGLIIGLTLNSVCKLPFGIFIGTVSLNIIFTGIIALGLPDNLQNVSLGLFLLIVVSISSKQDDIREYFKKKKANKKLELKGA